MKISLQWLADYLDRVPPAADIAEALTLGGFPVEEMHTTPAGDDVLEVEVTSNRPDLLSHVGVAREVAALMGLSFRPSFPAPPESAEPADSAASVAIEATDLCPHYAARIIRGVRVGPSPDWMQRRLEAVGLRPINNVVDVTNYVLFELGQPLHAFDHDKLAEGRIVVRTPRPGEAITTLDGQKRTLEPRMLCICDAQRPVAVAGVMGGLDSEVTDSTANILLEIARFDPLSVRTTSRRLRLMSDSSYRFERGLDPTLVERAGARAAGLIVETAGGTLLRGSAQAGGDGFTPRSAELRLETLHRLLGVELPLDEVLQALGRLGLDPVHEEQVIRLTVPSHRLDLAIEADFVEEAARVLGYDRIPLREQITVTVKPPSDSEKATGQVREVLTGAGYFEAITFSFVSDALADSFLPAGASLRRVEHAVRRADGHLRPSILPGLIESLRYNETVGNGAVRLFETGSVFVREAGGAAEHRRLALAGGEDYAQCRGVVELLLSRLDRERQVRIDPAEAAGFGSGACGRVLWSGAVVGHIGMLDRRIAGKLDLQHLPAIAELDLDALVDGYVPVPRMTPLSRYPAARRDVSLVVPEQLAYQRLADLVAELKLPDVEAVQHAGTYRGKPLERGQKSVTLTLVFRRADATVPREEADAAIQRFVEAATSRLGATLRT